MIGKFHLQSSGRRTEPRIDDGFSYWKLVMLPETTGKQAMIMQTVRAQGGD